MGPQGYLSTLHGLGIDTHFLGWVVALIICTHIFKCICLPLSSPLLNSSPKETIKKCPERCMEEDSQSTLVKSEASEIRETWL